MNNNNGDWVVGDSSGLGGKISSPYINYYGSNLASNSSKSLLCTNSAGTGDSGNLQPYIIIYRWHRTA